MGNNNNNNNNNKIRSSSPPAILNKSNSIYNFFSSRTNLFDKDDDGKIFYFSLFYLINNFAEFGLFLFLTTSGDDDYIRPQTARTEEVDFAPSSLPSNTTGHDTKEWQQSWWFLPVRSWAYAGIGVLLIVLCLSAGLLWYRMSLLHSHLEMRLLSDDHRPTSTQPNGGVYSQQVFIH